MKLINSYLPLLKDGERVMDEEPLLEECILPNIQEVWIKKLEVQNGNEQHHIKDVQKILCRIEK